MKKQTVIASFLILIFSFQLIPVSEIGKMLYQGLITEEIPHSVSEQVSKSTGEENHLQTLFNDFSMADGNLQASFFHHFCHLKERIPASHIIEQPTPPPNC